MKTYDVTHKAVRLEKIKYGEVFSYDGELFMKVEFHGIYFKDWAISTIGKWVVNLKTGHVMPMLGDPIVVKEDASITIRKGKKTASNKHEV